MGTVAAGQRRESVGECHGYEDLSISRNHTEAYAWLDQEADRISLT